MKIPIEEPIDCNQSPMLRVVAQRIVPNGVCLMAIVQNQPLTPS